MEEATTPCVEEEEEQSQQICRPSSLNLIPEREHLKFDIPTLVEGPPQVYLLLQQIQGVAEQYLYHWKSFPIGKNPAPDSRSTHLLTFNSLAVLPTPILQAVPSESPDLNRKSRAINLRDLFVPPPFDELDAVATDSHGEPRRLTFQQLRSLRERG